MTVMFPEMATKRPETPSERAAQLVRGDRQKDYGHPLDNHIRIAAFWTVRLADKLKPGEVIEPHEAAGLMRLMKEARLMNTPGHEDTLVDLCGYTDVEYEIHKEASRRQDEAERPAGAEGGAPAVLRPPPAHLAR